MKLSYYVQTAHRWLGLILAAQVLIWMASGVVMSWFDIELVRGETNVMVDFAPELEARSYANPGGVVAQFPGASSVALKTFLGRSVYEVSGDSGKALFDAVTGERLSPISKDIAEDAARRDFAGEAEIIRLELLTLTPQEYRGPLPVWRAVFNDRLETRLYISPETGAVLARRNKVWRLYDFFWMLHIMDYEERENFNNPLIRTAALTGFLFALTGLYLVMSRLRRGRYFSRRNGGK